MDETAIRERALERQEALWEKDEDIFAVRYAVQLCHELRRPPPLWLVRAVERMTDPLFYKGKRGRGGSVQARADMMQAHIMRFGMVETVMRVGASQGKPVTLEAACKHVAAVSLAGQNVTPRAVLCSGFVGGFTYRP